MPGRRRFAGLLAGAVVLLIVTGAVTASVRSGARQSRGRVAASGVLGAPTSSALTGSGATRDVAVTALLAQRAAAVLHHDETAFLATVDPAETTFYATQAATFTNMAPLPFASFNYQLEPAAAVGRRAPSGYGSTLTFAPDVVVHYTLAGYDVRPVSLTEVYTFVHRGVGWRIASSSDFASSGAPSEPDMWDFGPLVVVHDGATLVIAHPATAGLARSIAADVNAAVPVVDSVWGTGWAQRAVVELPATQAEMGALIGESAGLDQIAATESTESTESTEQHGSAAGAEQAATRITVNPAAFALLSTVGRQVVLTHELTHVASSAATTDSSPLWLVEGLADYVGFLHSGLAPQDIASELAAQVRTGDLPVALPTNADFGAPNPDLAATYEESWLACRVIVADAGQSGLVRFYRAVGDSGAAPDTATAAALTSVLHLSLAIFTAQWRQAVGALAP